MSVARKILTKRLRKIDICMVHQQCSGAHPEFLMDKSKTYSKAIWGG
jgi:hypothetical protein